MPPTEEAVFATLISNAAVSHAEGLIRARDERIRREIRNEVLEEAAKRADKHAIHSKAPEVMLALEGVASAIRSMKEAPRE